MKPSRATPRPTGAPCPESRLTRRGFHRACAASGVGVAWAATLDRATGSPFPAGQFVDVHTHLGQTWNTTQSLSAADLLKWMDTQQIAQAVVLPLVSPEASSYPLTSDFVLSETKPHRDRLVPFCSVDPRTSYNGGLAGLVAMLKRYVDAGAKGFGEHKSGVRIDDPRMPFTSNAQEPGDSVQIPPLTKAVPILVTPL